MLSGISPGRAEAIIVCNWSRKTDGQEHGEEKRKGDGIL